jgi:hypothetical protein
MDRYYREVPDQVYMTPTFERDVVLKNRTETIAKHLTKFLQDSDAFGKTIVFCVDQEHAENMRAAIARNNPELMLLQHIHGTESAYADGPVTVIDSRDIHAGHHAQQIGNRGGAGPADVILTDDIDGGTGGRNLLLPLGDGCDLYVLIDILSAVHQTEVAENSTRCDGPRPRRWARPEARLSKCQPEQRQVIENRQKYGQCQPYCDSASHFQMYRSARLVRASRRLAPLDSSPGFRPDPDS